MTSNCPLCRCWRCTAAAATSTWSCRAEVTRPTRRCGRSRPTTPSRSWGQTSWRGPRATTRPTSGNFSARLHSVFNQSIVQFYGDWGTSVFTDLTPSRINIKFHFAHNVLWLLKVYISCNAFDKISMDIEAQLHNTDLRWRWGNRWEMMTQQLTLRLQFNCTTLLKYPELINNLEIYNSPITLTASHPDLRVF